MFARFVLRCALLLVAMAVCTHGCDTDLNCSLNGLCTAGVCDCDAPWGGPSCGVLTYAVTPAVAKSLYPLSDPRNTWNGPIIGPIDGVYHIYDPIYPKGSLGGCTSTLHGTATAVEGPYAWDTRPSIASGCNPAFLIYDQNGTTVYTLWSGGVQAAGSPDGPFKPLPGQGPGGNVAPIYLDGTFYATTQHTEQVMMAKQPGGPWNLYANITVPWVTRGRREDPYMWVDTRGNWHIINHAYDTGQLDHCGNSTLSAHQFSRDGKEWNMVVPNVEPYSHTVQYDDGTSHTYTTLERPSLHFDTKGQLTHINLAADMITGDGGCNPPGKRTACTNCKYGDHAGTIIIKLDV